MPDTRAGLGRAGAALLLLLSAAIPAQAQTASDSINPFGRMSAAEIRPEVARTNASKFAAARDAPFAFGTLRFLDSPSSDSGSVVFGYDAPFRRRDLVVSGMYSRLSPDQGDDHNRWAVDGEMVLASLPAVTLSAVGGAAYETGGSRSYDVVLAAERGLLGRRLKLGANLGWASSSTAGAGTVRDVQVVIGAAFEATTAWSFSADYTFRNDVDGEDTGSFAVVRDLPRLKTKLKAGAAKHRVYALSLTRVF